ncbi:MAG: hypothetical protein FWH34_07970 [Desulfovibrionaceae bacterium]|nr:hypothetical protein [Desulfovibrionaceae bacterium]
MDTDIPLRAVAESYGWSPERLFAFCQKNPDILPIKNTGIGMPYLAITEYNAATYGIDIPLLPGSSSRQPSDQYEFLAIPARDAVAYARVLAAQPDNSLPQKTLAALSRAAVAANAAPPAAQENPATKEACQIVIKAIQQGHYLDTQGKIGRKEFLTKVQDTMRAHGKAHEYHATTAKNIFAKSPELQPFKRGRGHKKAN